MMTIAPGKTHHCSLGGGGSTSVVTNWTRILALPSAELMSSIVKHRRFPQEIMSTFLHEVTHHWCFHSLVGRAISESYLASRRFAGSTSATSEPDSRSDDSWNFFHNLVRFRVANSLFRPLSEGLALFAEHDIFPGKSELISVPMGALSRWFTPKDGTEESGVEGAQRELELLLLAQRVSANAENRKIQLLSQPLRYETQSPIAGVAGGYLAGYLTIKNLRIALLRRGCMKFLDADFFMCFVRSYIFEDFGLVERILAPISSEEKYAADLFAYFQVRMGALAIETTREQADEFEQWVLDPVLRLDPATSPLQSNSASIEAAQQALHDLELDLMGTASIAIDEALKHSDRWVVAQRHLICVAHSECEVRTTATHAIVEATVDGRRWPIISLPLHEMNAAPAPSGKGTCECYVSTVANLFAIAISVEGKLVSCFHLTDADEGVKRDFVDYRFDLLRAEQAESLADTGIEDLVGKLGLDTFLRALLSRLETSADEFYRKCALIFVDEDEQIVNVNAAMRDHGFLSFLDGDLSALEGFASLSLIASTTAHPELLRDILQTRGHDLDALRAEANGRGAKSGLQFLYNSDEAFFCAI
jgi:hypothetical protein